MLVPQKTRYALRGIFELSKHVGTGPVKIAQVAKVQAIPVRFLEVILNQLKQAGFVDSRRGKEGGYFLVTSPSKLTVGQVMSTLQGPVRAVGCYTDDSKETCPLLGDCVFLPMWEKVQEAVSAVYESTTFQDLVDAERDKREKHVPSYNI